MTSDSELQAVAALIAKRRSKALLRRDYLQLLLRVLFIALCGWLLVSQVFLFAQAEGSGMFPAVKDGDLIFGYRLQDAYAKDDVVVYTVQGRRHIGRVVAGAMDVVTLDDSGALLVNGTPQSGEILYPTYALEGRTYPLRVPEGHVFILGDYRTQTEDSRNFGPVPLDDVEAKVITILRRRGL